MVDCDEHHDRELFWALRGVGGGHFGVVALPGVGPISPAQGLVNWSHAGRLRSEAALAALAGVNPIPASSGQVTRHRLNRGGDRQLNRAPHTIVVAGCATTQQPRAYAARRSGEGKSARDIRRCLKRVVARQLLKLLERWTDLGCTWPTAGNDLGVGACRHLVRGAQLAEQAGITTGPEEVSVVHDAIGPELAGRGQ